MKPNLLFGRNSGTNIFEVIAFSLFVILRLSDTKVVSFDTILNKFRESSTKANYVSIIMPFIFSFISFPSDIFCPYLIQFLIE